jgi:gluconokinase
VTRSRDPAGRPAGPSSTGAVGTVDAVDAAPGPAGGATAPRAIVVMGVSGCGKSVVGEALARRLGARFVDADHHHPPANVEKMRSGIPLDDDDRAPWLERLNAVLRHAVARDEPVVLACSALRQRYRDALADRLPGLRFVHLSGPYALIAERLAARRHEYMPPTLLRSQFDALEPPADAVTIDIDAPVDAIADAAARALRA